MENAIQSAGVVDGLLVPHDMLFFTAEVVLDSFSILGGDVALVVRRSGEDEDESYAGRGAAARSSASCIDKTSWKAKAFDNPSS